MRVMSWNMYCYNKRHDEAVSFVANSGADIFFLQEVPHALRDRMCGLFPFSAYAIDSERLRGGEQWKNYNVILSRFPLTDTSTIQLDPLPLPIRTRIVIWLLSPIGWARTWNRNAVRARVETPAGTVEVASVHLTLSNPRSRAQEFRKVTASLDGDVRVVIGGDFNILEHWRVKPLTWFLGGTLSESALWYNERALFEQRFQNEELSNPLRGTITHAFSRSQLDHILISKELSVTAHGVLADLYGSDHAPIFVEL